MPHPLDIRTIQDRIKMNGKEELWMDWYSKVLSSALPRNVLLTPRNARRDGMLAPLMRSSALCRTGSTPTTSSILAQIRQAHECKIRCLYRCLLPRDENKDIDRGRNFPTVAKAAQPPVGRLLFFGFHWAILNILCVCVSLADQGSGHRKARGLAALLLIWLMGDLG